MVRPTATIDASLEYCIPTDIAEFLDVMIRIYIGAIGLVSSSRYPPNLVFPINDRSMEVLLTTRGDMW